MNKSAWRRVGVHQQRTYPSVEPNGQDNRQHPSDLKKRTVQFDSRPTQNCDNNNVWVRVIPRASSLLPPLFIFRPPQSSPSTPNTHRLFLSLRTVTMLRRSALLFLPFVLVAASHASTQSPAAAPTTPAPATPTSPSPATPATVPPAQLTPTSAPAAAPTKAVASPAQTPAASPPKATTPAVAPATPPPTPVPVTSPPAPPPALLPPVLAPAATPSKPAEVPSPAPSKSKKKPKKTTKKKKSQSTAPAPAPFSHRHSPPAPVAASPTGSGDAPGPSFAADQSVSLSLPRSVFSVQCTYSLLQILEDVSPRRMIRISIWFDLSPITTLSPISFRPVQKTRSPLDFFFSSQDVNYNISCCILGHCLLTKY